MKKLLKEIMVFTFYNFFCIKKHELFIHVHDGLQFLKNNRKQFI